MCDIVIPCKFETFFVNDFKESSAPRFANIISSTMNLRNFASILTALSGEEESSVPLRKSQRVIGGRESTNGRYSYAVSLADDMGSFCGGSLIAPDIVLSAAVSYKNCIIRYSSLS